MELQIKKLNISEKLLDTISVTMYITYAVVSLLLPHLFMKERNVLKFKLISKYYYECIMQHKNYS